MNLETIAEFVETREILDTLFQMGVDYAQGHYFDCAKPLQQMLDMPHPQIQTSGDGSQEKVRLLASK